MNDRCCASVAVHRPTGTDTHRTKERNLRLQASPELDAATWVYKPGSTHKPGSTSVAIKILFYITRPSEAPYQEAQTVRELRASIGGGNLSEHLAKSVTESRSARKTFAWAHGRAPAVGRSVGPPNWCVARRRPPASQDTLTRWMKQRARTSRLRGILTARIQRCVLAWLPPWET